MDRCGTSSRRCFGGSCDETTACWTGNLRIAAVHTNPMAIEETESDEERRIRSRRKKNSGQYDTLEVNYNTRFIKF